MLKRIINKSVQYSTSLLWDKKIPDNLHHQLSTQKNFQFCTSSSSFNQDLGSKERSSSSSMDMTLSIEHNDEIRSRAHKICSDLLGGTWSKITPNELSLVPISGGMSNLIFCCSLPESIDASDGEPTQTLLRLYGDWARNIDMSIQIEIFNLLSLKNLGPKLYGNFEDGRLEEFLQADSLTADELKDEEVSSVIAKKLATVHSLDVPIDKNNTWLLKCYSDWSSEFVGSSDSGAILDKNAPQSTIDAVQELLSINFNGEINFLRDLFNRTHSPLVFSHNDLHQGNILLAKYSKRRPTLDERIFLIDFEYCSYNYRAFDIANHFCEWCFEYDTPEYPHFMFFQEKFPNDSAQRNFIRNYLDQYKRLADVASSKTTKVKNNGNNNNAICAICEKGDDDRITNDNNGQHINSHSNGIKGEKAEEAALLDEVKRFFMAPNFLWTLWCIKSARSSTTKFGYWEYALTRWRLYSSFKSAYIEGLKTQTNGNNIT